MKKSLKYTLLFVLIHTPIQADLISSLRKLFDTPKHTHTIEGLVYTNPKEQYEMKWLQVLRYTFLDREQPKQGWAMDIPFVAPLIYYNAFEKMCKTDHGIFVLYLLYPWNRLSYKINPYRKSWYFVLGRESDDLTNWVGLRFTYHDVEVPKFGSSDMSLIWNTGCYLYEGRLLNLLKFNVRWDTPYGYLRFGSDPQAEYYIDHAELGLTQYLQRKSKGYLDHLSVTYYSDYLKATGIHRIPNPLDPTIFMRSNTNQKSDFGLQYHSTYRFRLTLQGAPYHTTILKKKYDLECLWQITALFGGKSRDRVYQVGLPFQINLKMSDTFSCTLIGIPYGGRFFEPVKNNYTGSYSEVQARPYSFCMRLGFTKKWHSYRKRS